MVLDNRFSINGRFLTQPKTGVQRYALNVINSIGSEASLIGAHARILAPKGTKNPKIDGMDFEVVGRSKGHMWEQVSLPIACTNKLLSLCNVGPAIKADQVICIHDANVFLEPQSYSKSFRTYYKTLQPLLARRAARITSVSKFSAEQIALHLDLKLSDIIVLPNGHEHVYKWDREQAIRAPLALGTDARDDYRPYVLALGSNARHKNISLLLGFARELDDLGLDLLIAGGRSAIFSSEQLRGASNVKHLGVVTDHDLAYLFGRAHCLAFPSLTEGFGLPPLEAMALGCPVISSDRASLPEICGNAVLFAAPDQPRRWIEQIKLLQSSSSLREDLIFRGHGQASLFSWTETARGYIDIMQNQSNYQKIPVKPMANPPSVAVVIATRGRPEVVNQILYRITQGQTYKPETVIVSCTSHEDIASTDRWPDIKILIGPAGLAAQRNTALNDLPESIEIVIFFDDDFVPAAEWIEVAVRSFCFDKNIVGFTGTVILDGIKGPGLTFEEADHHLRRAQQVRLPRFIDRFSPYGCNMAFRRSAVTDLRFDERLVLYGWLEDRDFGARLALKGGRLIKSTEAIGVHLGVKSGRIAGERLGYSQVMNPLYMLRKGTMSYRQVIDHLFRNVASNFIGSFNPEPFIDRRGRLRGNLRAVRDALQGYRDPERAVQRNIKNK